MKKLFITTAMTAALFATTVQANDQFEDEIKARQAVMQVYKFDWAILNNMAKEKSDYDADKASFAVKNLLAALNVKQDYMYPEGSHSEDQNNAENYTLPILWTDWNNNPEKIQQAEKRMLDAVLKMDQEAGKGLKALKAAMVDVNNGCKGCHDDYRKKKEN